MPKSAGAKISTCRGLRAGPRDTPATGSGLMVDNIKPSDEIKLGIIYALEIDYKFKSPQTCLRHCLVRAWRQSFQLHNNQGTMAGPGVPEPGREVPITLGSSLLDAQTSTHLHTFRYDFRPASVQSASRGLYVEHPQKDHPTKVRGRCPRAPSMWRVWRAPFAVWFTPNSVHAIACGHRHPTHVVCAAAGPLAGDAHPCTAG